MKNVLICGLGAVGLTYAVQFRGKCDLRILVDKLRLARYLKNKPVFNGKTQEFDYILPEAEGFKADLIIISTKFHGLESALNNMKNFISENTRIISLLNGISSEEIISSMYPSARVLKSYFIGHSAVREGNIVTQDGVGEIVLEYDSEVIKFLDRCAIKYFVPDDIDYAMWLKFTMNIFSNQTSAILKMTFGELKRNRTFREMAKKIISEVCLIAEQKGVKHLEKLESEALAALDRMCDKGKTSMHQDIIAGRKTEVDMFAGEIIKLGKEFGIATPYNQVFYDLIKIEEENNEYCIYTC